MVLSPMLKIGVVDEESGDGVETTVPYTLRMGIGTGRAKVSDHVSSLAFTATT